MSFVPNATKIIFATTTLANAVMPDGVYEAILVASSFANSATATVVGDITAGLIMSRVDLTNPTFNNTSLFFDADDPVFPNVPVGSVGAAGFVFFVKKSGANNVGRIIFTDNGATGLPLTTNGTNVTYNINATGLFSMLG